jgi:hypothetical protein
VTAVPALEHISEDVEVMLTDGTTTAFTVIVIPTLEAGFPTAQGDAFEVNTVVTTSPFTRNADENVLLFVPAFTPFTFH